MGGSTSKETIDSLIKLTFDHVQDNDLLPHIGIDDTLLKYSGLDSPAVLQDYSSRLANQVLTNAPSSVASLGSALAALNAVPNAVGLGALIISLILDLAIPSSSLKSSQNTVDMLRRVFAEEKASSVRDSIDEYLKRLKPHVKDTLMALEETERLEKDLSKHLTALKNSMLYDNQMSSRSMKHWVNGAAFHLQMLVHAARLKMSRTTSNRETELKKKVDHVSTVVEIYQRELRELLEKYKDYSCLKLTNKEVNGYSLVIISDDTPEIPFCFGLHQKYVNYMFNNWKLINQLETYFSDLKKNLRELILQQQIFNPPKIRPA